MNDEMVRLSNIKIYRAAFPELVAELEKIAPRHRADRLRMLASLGLLVMNHGIADSLVNNVGTDTNSSTSSMTSNDEHNQGAAKPDTTAQQTATVVMEDDKRETSYKPPDSPKNDLSETLKDKSGIAPEW